ncbi:hypothetical protein [Paenibacillus caui]|nr:hypothetical protein [Paenibacillus caui]
MLAIVPWKRDEKQSPFAIVHQKKSEGKNNPFLAMYTVRAGTIRSLF